MRAPVWAVATLAWILCAGGVCLTAAQQSQPASSVSNAAEPDAKDKVGKELHALRITGAAPRIDGRFDDEVWARAEAIVDFVQEEPENMNAPSERMTIRIAYDDRYLYAAVEMFMSDPSEIRDGLGRRGLAPPSDLVSVEFDTAHDHENAYIFEVNASGVQNDYTMFGDTNTNLDYEAVWEVATARTPQGWNAEYRIPFSQMRFPIEPGQRTVWGFNVKRVISSRAENDWWIAKPRGEQGGVSRFGHLIFDDHLAPPRRIEFTPYTLGQVQTQTDAASSASANAGFDLRLGLGSSATLSTTVNPDFGQVEADPSVLNLSTVETFYPEKRAFFLEDSGFVANQNFGQFPDFYSRRIGAAPGRLLASNETIVKTAAFTRILGAAKLSGRTANWTYGGLSALTSREFGTVDVTDTLLDGSSLVHRERKLLEPRTLYSAGRLQRSILGDTSAIGLTATSVVREKDFDAVTAGGEWTIRSNRNRFFSNGHWIGTDAPIDGVKRGGFGGSSNMSYTSKYFNVNGHIDHFGRHFHNSDLGFIGTRANKNETNGGALLYQPDPKGVFRNSAFNVFGDRQWNDKGLKFGSSWGLSYDINFTNFWHVNLVTVHDNERFDDIDARGGPAIWKPPGRGVSIQVDSDTRRRTGLSLHQFTYRNAIGGWQIEENPSVRFQPSQRLLGSIGVDVTSALDSAQWIKNIDTNHDGVENELSDAHVYGTLRRHILNITARSTYSFTRDLTLETYLQPFVAVGHYTDVRTFSTPRSYIFTPTTLADNPDFNRKSVRGTVVLRWEYIRGSTLFAVWNLSTDDEAKRLGLYSPWRDLGGAFGAPSTNTFAIKLSYWFTP